MLSYTLEHSHVLYTMDNMVVQLGITVHGFRSAFRDWAAENTPFPRELAEKALAHTLRDKTEAAYRRGPLLEKRRRMMEDWANYCTIRSTAAGDVVPLRGEDHG